MSTQGPPRFREWKLGCKVYIGNLNEGASKADIEGAFSKYGPLRNVWVARNPPGFAFVEFEDGRDAETACRNLDGTRIAGGRIKAEMSHGRSRRGRGPPGFGVRGPPPPYPVDGPYGGRGPWSGPPRGHYNGGGDYPYYEGYHPYSRGGYHGGGHHGHYAERPRERHALPPRPRSPMDVKEYRHGYSRSRSNSLGKSPPPPPPPPQSHQQPPQAPPQARATARPRTPPSRTPSPVERH